MVQSCEPVLRIPRHSKVSKSGHSSLPSRRGGKPMVAMDP